MRIVFFGTPAFADASLRALLAGRHQVAAAVTQPDRPKGRSRDPVPPPVKETAGEAGIPVLQPTDLRDQCLIQALQAFEADLGVVVAYGRILPKQLLEAFPKGAVNLHASLLPKYRGAAPVQWAIIRGETETGVTVFKLDEQLDHGEIYAQAHLPIYPEDDAVRITEELSNLGNVTLARTLDMLEDGGLQPFPQDESLVTLAPPLKKEDGLIDWNREAEQIRNLIRGVQPWPGAATPWAGKQLKILAASADPQREAAGFAPGTVAEAGAGGLWVQAGKGQLRIDRLQAPGGNPMAAAEFLRGHPLKAGDRLV